MRKQFILYSILIVMTGAFAIEVSAQDHQVTGTVTAQDTGEPLVGVNIIIKDTATGTVTDRDGNYQLSTEPDNILIFSAIGFVRQEIEIEGRNEIDIVLRPDVGRLGELVVIGYGEQARDMLTTSVSTVDTRTLENVPYANPMSALQGRVAGLRVASGSGQPGSTPSIVLRGGTSITNPGGATPLYVVDGVVRSDLQGINPRDIESIQVLKDAAATSIYGSRASDGVIVVTTKSGVAGDMQVNYNYSVGVASLARQHDLVGAEDYIHYGRLGLAATAEQFPGFMSRESLPTGFGIGNDRSQNTFFTPQYLESGQTAPGGWQTMPDPLDPSRTIMFQETDWQDVLFNPANTHNHYISVSGGSETARYKAGIGYLDNNGIALGTGYKRLTADLRADIEVFENLRVSGQANFSNQSSEQVDNTGWIFERALSLPPTTKYRFEDGTLAPGQNRSMGNPEYYQQMLQRQNNTQRLTLGFNADWGIIPDKLYFEPSLSLYAVNGISNAYDGAHRSGASFVDSRNASGSHSLYWQRQVDGVLTFSDSFADLHNLEVKAGATYYDDQTYQLSAAGRGAASDNVPTLNAAGEPTNVTSNFSELVMMGYFSRVTYDYDRRYLFSGSYRIDGASNFGRGNQWGYFPGISFGWNIHNESFWPSDQTVVDQLKLRASYGATGNNRAIGNYHAQGEYMVGNEYNTNPAIINNRMPNQNLRWEKSTTFNTGLDLSLFNNRISILFDYYNRVTDDILWAMQLPMSTGFQSITTNLASFENRGFEMELDALVMERQNFFWSASFNVGYTTNQILSLPENDNENNRIGGIFIYDPSIGDYVWAGGFQEGHSIGKMFAYEQIGIFVTDEEAQAGPTDRLVQSPNHEKHGGDVNWRDVDGNGVIDARDRVYQGNELPPWSGGIATNISYRNFGLNIAMDYAAGHTIYNYIRARQNGQFQGDQAPTTDVLRSWQEQGDETDVPRYHWADQFWKENIWRGSSWYYERGDYLSLREVTLSYRAPVDIASRLGMQNLRLYLTGSNLHYFTSYRGLIPEMGGTDGGRYPHPRTITAGIDITF
ncbi:TonB-dependent receptor [soil metagenome]